MPDPIIQGHSLVFIHNYAKFAEPGRSRDKAKSKETSSRSSTDKMCLSLVNPQDLPPRRGKQIKTDQPVRINSRDRAGTRDEKNLRNFSLGATTLTGVGGLARRNTVNAVGMATQKPSLFPSPKGI